MRSSSRLRPTAASSSSSSASPAASSSGERLKVCQPCPWRAVRRSAARRLAADVDGGRLLHGLGVHLAGGQVVDVAVEGGRLVEPERAQHLEVLVGAAAPALPGHVEHVELLLEPADADAEVDPAVREPVEGADLLGGVDGVALGEEQHGRAEPDRARARRQVGQRDHRLEQAAARRGGDAAVVGVGVAGCRSPRRGRRARPPRWSRCRAPRPRRPRRRAARRSSWGWRSASTGRTSRHAPSPRHTKEHISSAARAAGIGSGSPARTDSAP